jgi:hypothetical protein
MFPPFPPMQQIILVALSEALFGLGYNRLVEWANIPSAYAVIGGCAVTIGIGTAAWMNLELAGWQWAVLMLVCFGASGIPMTAGFMHRNKKKHKRMQISGAAARIRGAVVMELKWLANAIATQSKSKALTTADLPEYVQRLYQAIGLLEGM